MINVKDNGDGSFIIEWDENDPEESILNDWTKEDFIDFFNYRLGLEKSQQEYVGKNAEKFRGKSKETSNVSEATTEEDYEDFWEEYDGNCQEIKDPDKIYDNYIQATNEETFGKDGYPTKDDRIWEG